MEDSSITIKLGKESLEEAAALWAMDRIAGYTPVDTKVNRSAFEVEVLLERSNAVRTTEGNADGN